ncbi:hypothetical protein, partial [Cereibacter changlensis]|uniref:hypothetical protein n=1 Tax=Cereibacter changlensis TaxID=402884 RepID=UPI001B808247
ALSVAATSAFAGGMVEPIMEPAVVEAQTSSSAGGIVVPLLLLLTDPSGSDVERAVRVISPPFSFVCKDLAYRPQPARLSV